MGVSTFRLVLFYNREVDSWLISDTVDGSGNVLADCGPIGQSADLSGFWRVFDGETWREDRNVTAEVSFGDPVPFGLQGLRVAVPPPSSAPARTHRSSSQEPSIEMRSEARRAPASARASSGKPAKPGMAYPEIPASILNPRSVDSARARLGGTDA